MVTEAAPVAETLIPPAETPVEATTPITGAPPVADVIPESPAPAAPSVPPPPVAPFQPSLEQRVEQFAQQRNQELRAREQQVQQQEDSQALQQYQFQLAAQIEQKYGLAPEQAAELATQQAQIIYQGYQQQQAATAAVQGAQAKVMVATMMSQQYGAPVATLMQYNSPQEMQAAGERMKSDGALRSEVEQLRAQVAKLTKGSVPAQNFGTGAVGAGGAGLNEQALEKAVASGQIAMTPEISARLNKYWAQ